MILVFGMDFVCRGISFLIHTQENVISSDQLVVRLLASIGSHTQLLALQSTLKLSIAGQCILFVSVAHAIFVSIGWWWSSANVCTMHWDKSHKYKKGNALRKPRTLLATLEAFFGMQHGQRDLSYARRNQHQQSASIVDAIIPKELQRRLYEIVYRLMHWELKRRSFYLSLGHGWVSDESAFRPDNICYVTAACVCYFVLYYADYASRHVCDRAVAVAAAANTPSTSCH